jgi:hypothetical protein
MSSSRFLIAGLFLVAGLSPAFALDNDDAAQEPTSKKSTEPESANEKERREKSDKSVELFKMKDQSNESTAYENLTAFEFAIGYSGVVANPDTEGFGVKSSGLTFRAGYGYHLMPDFSLVGTLSFAHYGTDSYYGISSNNFSLGMGGLFHFNNFAYIGIRAGLELASLSGEPEFWASIGPSLGLDFRIGDALSVGVETNFYAVTTGAGNSMRWEVLPTLKYWFK